MLELDNAKDKDAARRIRECAVDLLLRTPLFGLTLLGHAVRVKELAGADTMCTDGRTIWYDPAWVHKKPRPSIGFDLLHELLHVYGNHPARRGSRDHKIWGYAIDVRVAHDALAIMRARGPWKLDDDHVPALPWAEFLSAEEIYDKLLQDPTQVPKDYVPDTREPPPATADEDQEFKRKLTEDLSQASIAEDQQNKGKTIAQVYNNSIHERLQTLKRCDVPWEVMLQGRLASAFGHDIAAWVPPNKKFFPEIALPSRRGAVEASLLLGIDISGSITEEDLARFRACIMPAACRAKETTVVTFDAVVRECATSSRPDTLLRKIKFATGGHSFTDVRGVFEEVERKRPSAVAIITDGYVIYPAKEYPTTHWILTPSGAPPPWGKIYKLHYSW